MAEQVAVLLREVVVRGYAPSGGAVRFVRFCQIFQALRGPVRPPSAGRRLPIGRISIRIAALLAAVRPHSGHYLARCKTLRKNMEISLESAPPARKLSAVRSRAFRKRTRPHPDRRPTMRGKKTPAKKNPAKKTEAKAPSRKKTRVVGQHRQAPRDFGRADHAGRTSGNGSPFRAGTYDPGGGASRPATRGGADAGPTGRRRPSSRRADPTPRSTSAILREIAKKGKESRFTKTERGKFVRTDPA
jgi:hypothetical protein